MTCVFTLLHRSESSTHRLCGPEGRRLEVQRPLDIRGSSARMYAQAKRAQGNCTVDSFMTSLTRPEDDQEVTAADGETKPIWRRILTVIAVAATMLAMDALTIKWVIPWADEMTKNPFMSLGYIVAFFAVLINFVVFFALVAHVPHQESYPSDQWK